MKINIKEISPNARAVSNRLWGLYANPTEQQLRSAINGMRQLINEFESAILAATAKPEAAKETKNDSTKLTTKS